MSLLTMIAGLTTASVEFVVIGGVAARAHGSTRITEDLDICYDPEPENLDRLVALLDSWSAYPRGIERGLPFIMDRRTFEPTPVMTPITSQGALDVFDAVKGVGEFDAVKEASEEVDAGKLESPALDLPSLVEAKKVNYANKVEIMISKYTAFLAVAASLLTANATAQSTANADQTSVDQAPEARAIWVARFSYETPDDVRAIINNAADYNFNIIIFQVRGNATTFYKSELEPWAWELTSDSVASLGQDPGWDPLALAIELAHERGLELHAWVNFLPGWRRTIPPPEDADQLWNTHRDWFMQNKAGEVMWPHDWWDYWMSFLDPGVPEVKKHIHDVFMEIVENYDVDGIHYDFVRYPSEVGDWAYNPVSVERFKKHY
ncbi:MAG: glycoside hydrolase family 10 protein, partial [Rhodothermia bacterium]